MSPPARRVFLVGTDTDCGKTAVACALLRAAAAEEIAALPFKPAVSGAPGPGSDPARLCAAAALDLHPDEIAPLAYDAPIAPGIAEDPAPFVDGAPTRGDALARARRVLSDLEARYSPELTLIEGAGGLWVPMPGGGWLVEWIAALDAAPLVVGRAGLGTINHTILTIDALRARGREPLGFIHSQTTPGADPSRALNPRIIARARGVACLGILPFGEVSHGWYSSELWARLGLHEGARLGTA